MAIEELLNRKADTFLNARWSTNNLLNTFLQIAGTNQSLLHNLDNFIEGFDNREHLKFVLLKALNKVKNVQFSDLNSKDYIPFSVHTSGIFESKRQEIVDELVLKLEYLGADIHAEMFTKEEWNELIKKVDDIAVNLFDLIKKNSAGQEVIYNSVDEVREHLMKDAESSKLFGKEFVTQQLSGKILDMAFKGSFFAMLSQSPENLIDLSNHIKSIM